MDYYNRKQFLAHVGKNNNVINEAEKWFVHQKGILHRGFTVGIFYKNQLILQHRRHLAFDGYFDLTCSSHPLVINGKIQSNQEAVFNALKREWNISQKDLLYEPKNKGSIIFKAKDNVSGLIEHEYCYLYISAINFLPQPNLDFAYGFSLMTVKEIKNPKNPTRLLLAPWLKKFIEENLI